MEEKYLINPNYPKNKKTAILHDLDGCLINSEIRFHRLDLEALKNRDKDAFVKSLKWYNSDTEGDTIIESGAEFLWALCDYYKPDKVFFITARGTPGYEPTMQWLKDHNIFGPDKYGNELIMQPEDYENYDFDKIPTHEWKKSIAQELMKNYEILLAVDDGDLNCESYVSAGITTMKFIAPNIGRVLL